MKQKLTMILMFFSLFLVSCEEDGFDVALAPIVTMGEVKDIYRTAARLTANVERSEGRSIVESGFIISTSNDFANMTFDEIKQSSSCKVERTPSPVTAGQIYLSVTGLQAKTHYYCCAYVTSGYSVARSEVKEFTTVESSQPVFEDITLSDLTVNSCHVSTLILDIGGEDAVKTFEIWYRKVGVSETPQTLNRNECVIIDAPGYSATLRELEQNTRYAVCANVVTTTGRTAQSKVACFTTGTINVTFAAPSINKGQDYIEILQAVNTNEMVINEGVFYSAEVKVPNENNKYVFDSEIDNNINVRITDLLVGNYYVRPFAQVKKDDVLFYVYGDVVEVSIEEPAPVLSECQVGEITSSSVAVSAEVTNSVKCGERGFCYAYGSVTPTIADNTVTITADKPFSAVLQSLKADTDITICAYAINNSGAVGYGAPVKVHTAKKAPSSDDNVFPEVRP